MKRIAAGDREIFSHIVEIYMIDMYRFAFSILKSPSKAEDIVQETCLRIWNKAGQWKPSGSLKSWILRIVHNLCIDEIRKHKKEVPLDDTVLTMPDIAPSQFQTHAKKQTAKTVNEALFCVPDRQRIALTLVYYHGYSNTELAYIMDTSVDAAESLLARGRLKMRKLLADSKNSLLEGVEYDQ